MAYQLVILTVLCASTQLLLKDCAGESTEDHSKLRRRQPNNLTCYVCHSETHADCLNLTGEDTEDELQQFARPCGISDTSCIVKKISFTTSTGNTANSTQPMKTVAVKRNCTKKCEPGCVIMGERTRLYICSTCCTDPNCNNGNGASKSMPNVNAVLIISAWIFQLFRFLLPHHTLTSMLRS